jgi:hypothetical protein
MRYQKEREQFIVRFCAEGGNYYDAIRILRDASTLARLAEAQCNGDWPCDNGERKVKPCAECQSGYAPSVLLKGGRCPDCRTSARLRDRLTALGFSADFSGDPRGYVVKLHLPSGAYNTWGGKESGYGVPTRS